MLIAHILGLERHELYLNRDLTIGGDERAELFRLTQRRCMGEPIQYIIGHREFMGLSFSVDNRVLIPRCDTETLVETAIELLPKDRDILVGDMGTGSGAIAVSVAYYMPNVRVFAVDIDGGSLEVAMANAKAHGVEDRIEFLRGDMFTPFGEELEGKFDAILSNPPYIPTGDMEQLSIQIKEHEPKKALDGGEDGLTFYRRIAKEGHIYLKEGGFMGLEVGYNQGSLVSNILQDMGATHICCVQDLSGIDR